MWLLAAAALSAGPAHAVDCDADYTIAPGDLTISEFMAEPDGVPNYYGEWIEIYNGSGRNVSLEGLRVQGTSADAGFTITSPNSTDVLLAAGDYFVLGVSDNTAQNGNVDVDYVYAWTDFQMEHAADTIKLVYDGVTVDQVTWNNSSGWEVTRDKAHQVNIAALDNEWANNLARNWCQSKNFVTTGTDSWHGTPGAANSPSCDGINSDSDGDGYTESQGDCNDDDPEVHPDQVDGDADPYGVADDDADCNGRRDDGVCDDDGDGYAEIDGDCDDDAYAVSPSEPDILDGVDNDCNGCIDDKDDDGDGWTDCDTGEVVTCFDVYVDDEQTELAFTCTSSNFDPANGVYPQRYVEGACAVAYDCAEGDNSIAPCSDGAFGGETYYDGIDQTCDWLDACDKDGDGFDGEDCIGNPDPGQNADRPADCDDSDASVYPGGDEGDPQDGGQPDGKDNDCNGTVDDPYADADDDGYRITDGDCWDDATDPRAAEVYPGAPETCGDELDNDCNGMIDDGCTFPLGFATVRGGGLCAVASGAPGALGGTGLVALLGLLAAGARRRRSGER